VNEDAFFVTKTNKKFMKKIILFLILALLLSGIAYGTYLYIQELNPTWERRAGLVEAYQTNLDKESIQGTYTYKSKTGTMRLILSKEKAYEIYLMREGVEYLYSQGSWIRTIDESVFPEKVSYLLKSEKIEASAGEFRFRHHEMKGFFFDPQKKNAPIKYYVHFPKQGSVYETWTFRINEGGLLDVKTSNIYQRIGEETQEEEKALKFKTTKVAPKVSTKERHAKANITPTSIQKIKNKVESVYDCKGGYGAMTVRLVILSGMNFEIHILENDKEFLYSKGVYAGARRISLNGTEIAAKYAAYRLENHSYHGTLINDRGVEKGMKAIRTVGEVWNAKTIFETWMFRKTEDGNFLDMNDKKVFVYNKDLSK
jgi:hypothetical protein